MKLEETIKIKANSESEAQAVIDEYKEGSKGAYTLKKASYELKEKTSKGEVIASAYVVSVTLVHNNLWD